MVYLPWVTGLAVALVAIGVGVHLQKKNRPQTTSTDAADSRRVVYVIGDLHGDVDCAKYWFDRLKLVNQQQTWLEPHASLVFMGDYVDKGPYSLQTIQFVKSLTDAFPDRVTALMGNHELELLRDRQNPQIKYLQLAYSSVHPQEYLNFLERNVQESDHLVVDLLLNVSLEIYARRWHPSVLLAPEVDPQYKRHAITEFFDESMRPMIQERLQEYQESYLKAFASNSSLGQWLEQRPVAHVENGVFFCHGGISESIVEQIKRVGGVDALNELVQKNSGDDSFRSFLEETPEGRAVYEMLVYRGNHKKENCGELDRLLRELNVERLAVGHTPGQNVRSSCSDQFWAIDSLLGRWIRTSGNFYCPTSRRASQDGRFICNDLVATCQGQVVKVTTTGVEIIS